MKHTVALAFAFAFAFNHPIYTPATGIFRQSARITISCLELFVCRCIKLVLTSRGFGSFDVSSWGCIYPMIISMHTDIMLVGKRRTTSNKNCITFRTLIHACHFISYIGFFFQSDGIIVSLLFSFHLSFRGFNLYACVLVLLMFHNLRSS